MNEKLNFNNNVILIHGTIVVVIDDYDALFYIDNGGIEYAYELGDSVDSDDLTPLSELPAQLRDEILGEL